MRECPKLAVVVPCYNEADVISHTFANLYKKLTQMIESAIIAADSMLVFIDDGSSDSTYSLLKSLCSTNMPPP